MDDVIGNLVGEGRTAIVLAYDETLVVKIMKAGFDPGILAIEDASTSQILSW